VVTPPVRPRATAGHGKTLETLRVIEEALDEGEILSLARALRG
jgi:hypothetical protein